MKQTRRSSDIYKPYLNIFKLWTCRLTGRRKPASILPLIASRKSWEIKKKHCQLPIEIDALMIQTRACNSSSSYPPSILRRLLMITPIQFPILLAAKWQGPSTMFTSKGKDKGKSIKRNSLRGQIRHTIQTAFERVLVAAPLTFSMHLELYPDEGGQTQAETRKHLKQP